MANSPVSELPDPVHVVFPDSRLRVTVWMDFCGHFTNKVYVFSSVGDLDNDDDDRPPSENARAHLAYVRFHQVTWDRWIWRG